MIKKFEIDENLIAMAAFTKIVKKYYKGTAGHRSPKVIEKFKQAMISPESFCKLSFDPDDIQRKYANLKITVELEENVICDSVVRCDILAAYEEIIKFDDLPAINAGKFLNMLDDKTIGLYKIGDFAPERDDKYFMDVLDKNMEMYKPYNPFNEDNANSTDNADSVDVEQIAKKVKSEILSEITQEIPKAFEKAMYTNIKNVK